jgi:two-component system sensor histidine kinase DctS
LALPREGLASRALAVSPLLAILAIVGLLGVLVWLLDRDEKATLREELIRDTLWVEQVLRFQLDNQTTRLKRFAIDLAGTMTTPTSFALEAGQLMQINREQIEILWVGGEGGIVEAVPRRPRPSGVERLDTPRSNIQMARTTGRARVTPPFRLDDGRSAIAFIAPIMPADGPHGALVVIFSLDLLLAQEVPWWIGERRSVSLRDTGRAVLASRSSVATDPGAEAYTVEIGDPFQDVYLSVVTFRTGTSLAQNSVIGAMIALGLFAAGGIIAREHHLRRRRAVEFALDEEHAFRRAMEASLRVGVRARDLDGRILYVNQGFCRMVGYSEDELVGRDPPMPYWLPEELEQTRRLHDEILAGGAGSQGMEFVFRRKDGTRFNALVYETPLVDAGGRQRGWMGSVIDITDRKKAEELARLQAERMQHTARLVTVGEMASLLAHELNQPLAAISSYASGIENMLAGGNAAPPRLTDAAKAIVGAAAGAGRIVRRVHSFAKRSEPRLEPVPVRELVAETLAFLEPELRKGRVLASTRLQPMLPAVLADRVLIEQVLVNLVRNSIEAMRETPGERREVLVMASWPAEHGRVRLSVVDHGCGVAPALVERLFTPFITTKPGGMGMGLTICRSILELHGSSIVYEPAAGGGAMFHFSLAPL